MTTMQWVIAVGQFYGNEEVGNEVPIITAETAYSDGTFMDDPLISCVAYSNKEGKAWHIFWREDAAVAGIWRVEEDEWFNIPFFAEDPYHEVCCCRMTHDEVCQVIAETIAEMYHDDRAKTLLEGIE